MRPRSAELLHSYLQRELKSERDNVLKYSGEDPRLRYSVAFTDLNGDGKDEAIVYVTGNHVCGSGGCDLTIYTPAGRSWRTVTQMSISRPPIGVLSTSTHGWRDIAVYVAGGGILPGYEAQLKFNGQSYPSNPSVAPAQAIRKGVQIRVLISPTEKGRPVF